MVRIELNYVREAKNFFKEKMVYTVIFATAMAVTTTEVFRSSGGLSGAQAYCLATWPGYADLCPFWPFFSVLVDAAFVFIGLYATVLIAMFVLDVVAFLDIWIKKTFKW